MQHPETGNNGKLFPPLAIAEVGGEGCLIGAVALTEAKQLEITLGEVGAGKINTQPFLSYCLLNSSGVSHWLNPMEARRQEGVQLMKSLETSLLATEPV